MQSTASVEDMAMSITDVMSAHMMGDVFTGADICGTVGVADSELCARWHVVGSFYPLSRNFKSYGYEGELPSMFDFIYEDGIEYKDIMLDAIYNKYSLMKYYYS